MSRAVTDIAATASPITNRPCQGRGFVEPDRRKAGLLAADSKRITLLSDIACFAFKYFENYREAPIKALREIVVRASTGNRESLLATAQFSESTAEQNLLA